MSSTLLQRPRSAGFGLPLELLSKGRDRLSVILWFTLFGAGLSFSVRLLRALTTPEAVQREGFGLAYVALAAAVSGTFLWLVRLRPERPGFALQLGLIYELIAGYIIALGGALQEAARYGHAPFLTWTVPLIVMFPLIVPSPPRITLIAAILTGSSSWVALAVCSAVGLLHAAPSAYLEASVSPIIATVFAYFGSRVVHGLNLDYAAATRAGSYVLQSKLGEGGMGEVWRAEHRLLARPAAVKLIRREMLDPSPDVALSLGLRFEREARATALLRSPHTVALYDYGSTPEGSFFYVMELLDGLDLHSLVHQHGPMPAERAVHLLSQAAASLAEAHAQHLIHRDVKPANIYVCQQGLISDFVKVLDFGLVKTEIPFDDVLDANLSAECAVRGTPAFMAPEQIWGTSAASPAADMYSLGCVAFWLLTGRYPFLAGSPVEMLLEHVRSVPPRASTLAPSAIPEELDAIIAACLAKEPGDRPASMLELSERLAAVPLTRTWDQTRALGWWQAHAPDVLARTPGTKPASRTPVGALAS